MKTRILTLVALLFIGALTVKAQIVPVNDPIGTIYTSVTKMTGGMSVTTTQTLLKKEGNAYTLQTKSAMAGVPDMETTTKVENGMLVQSIEDAAEQMKQELKAAGMGELDVEVSGELYRLPLSGKVGDKFPGTTYTCSAQLPVGSYAMTYSVEEIEVIGSETIDLPAGRFECIVLQMPTEMSISMMGQNQVVKINSKLWVSKDYGVVKQLQKNNMTGDVTTELTAIKKP